MIIVMIIIITLQLVNVIIIALKSSYSPLSM